MCVVLYIAFRGQILLVFSSLNYSILASCLNGRWCLKYSQLFFNQGNRQRLSLGYFCSIVQIYISSKKKILVPSQNITTFSS